MTSTVTGTANLPIGGLATQLSRADVAPGEEVDLRLTLADDESIRPGMFLFFSLTTSPSLHSVQEYVSGGIVQVADDAHTCAR